MVQISVVLPVYNQAEYLSEALDSIFSQTHTSFELIVVNDGSTDSTENVLASCRRSHTFRQINQTNQGVASALDAGFSEAHGDYLTWTSADNIMLPEMLAVLSSVLDEHPNIGMVYADWYVIDGPGIIISLAQSIDYDRLLLLRTNYINACFLYRRECLEKVGGYNPRLRGSEDWDYWLRISKHFRMQHVMRPLYKYRLHANSLSANPQALVPYAQFEKVWKSDNLLAWYTSLLKWHLLKRISGRQPGVTYCSAV